MPSGPLSSDREYQLHWLNQIVDDGARSPFFKTNPKYPQSDQACRMSYDDVMGRRWIVRIAPDSFDKTLWSGDTQIVAEYKSIEELVDDGWRLD